MKLSYSILLILLFFSFLLSICNIGSKNEINFLFTNLKQIDSLVYIEANLDKAEILLKQISKSICKKKNDQLSKKYNLLLSFVLLKQRKFHHGIALTQSLLERNNLKIDDNYYCELYKNLGYYYFQLLDTANSIKYFNKSIFIAKQIRDTFSIVKGLIGVASNQANAFDYFKCDELLNSAMNYANSNELLLGHIFKQKSINNRLQGCFIEADSFSNIAKIYFRNNKISIYDKSQHYTNSAALNLYLNKFDNALKIIDTSEMTLFGSLPNFNHYKTNIESVYLLTIKANIISSKAISINNYNLGIKAFEAYKLVDSILSYFRYDEEMSFTQNNFYHNIFYSNVIKHASWMFNNSCDEKWIFIILNYFNKHKSQALLRDRKIAYLKKNNAYSKYFKKLNYFEYNIKKLNQIEENTLNLNNYHFTKKYNYYNLQYELLKNLKKTNINLYKYIYDEDMFDSEVIMNKSKFDNIARIYYYVGVNYYNSKAIYVIYIYKNKIDHILLENPLKISKLITELNQSIINLNNNYDFKMFCNKSYSLFNILLKPIYNDISDADQIAIIPDNIIETVPFDCLVTNNNLLSPKYLIDSKDISYSFFVNEYDKIQNMETLNTLDYLGFAWSDKKSIKKLNGKVKLKELPNSYFEVLNSSKWFKNKLVFGGEDALKQNFIKYANKANILHIALHSNKGNSRLSNKIYFRSKSRNGLDSLLSHELQSLDIDPAILVLSSCESAAGVMHDVEGAFSIARSFYGFGSRNIIANDWEASDNYSKNLFDCFYKNLAMGKGYSKSLAIAKRVQFFSNFEFRKSPGLWSGIKLYN